MLLLDGKIVSKIKTQELKKRVEKLIFKPTLAIVQIGNNFDSNKYINNKIKKANEIGILVKHYKFDVNIKQTELINNIKDIKNDYDGIIVQLPLPSHLDKQTILDCIDLEKDVDGLSTKNMNNFYNDKNNYFIPATARAIMMLLNHYKIELKNKKIMIIGESNLVGKPIKKLMKKFSFDVESRNKKTGINGTNEADILIVAAGWPNLINSEHIKENVVIIDVGINTLNNNKIIGDVNFNDVIKKVKAISPSPGGVGPLTVISLLENLIEKCENKTNSNKT